MVEPIQEIYPWPTAEGTSHEKSKRKFYRPTNEIYDKLSYIPKWYAKSERNLKNSHNSRSIKNEQTQEVMN